MAREYLQTGLKFERLTVVKYAGNRLYLFKCDCGKEKEYLRWSVTSGKIKSCGCLAQEFMDNIGERSIKHGHIKNSIKSPTYSSWESMWARVNQKNKKRYKDYGGRGITIEERWKDFSLFLLDMGERPEGKTLDRKDNNKGYSIENCKWSSLKEQGRNKRNNNIINYQGREITMVELSETLEVDYEKLRYRITTKGMNIEDAVMQIRNSKQK